MFVMCHLRRTTARPWGWARRLLARSCRVVSCRSLGLLGWGEVLNDKLSKRWKIFSPPYVFLLIRTFLTLEGIAEKVDPDFNIYEICAPFALRRCFAPSSAEGVAALRGVLLNQV